MRPAHAQSSSPRSGFDPRAALVSLAAHGLAIGTIAAVAATMAPPAPDLVYAVIYAEPAFVEAARAAVEPVAPPASQVPDEIAPEVPGMPATAEVFELPVSELALEAPAAEPKPAKPPRPKPVRRTPAAEPAVPAAPAPAAPVENVAAAENGAAADSIASLAHTAPGPAEPVAAPQAPPAPAEPPLIQTARFRAPPAPPVYPRRAIEFNLRGTTVLRALVQPDGIAAEIVVWRSSGVRLLDEAALAAARGWAFEPARHDSIAITAWVEVPVRFELN